jgi:thiol peroxidase
MASITLGGNPCHTVGELPAVGSKAPAITVTGTDVQDLTSDEFAGTRVVLSIFPSVGTGVCAASERRFNELAAGLEDTKVVSVSMDLPFALNAFCAGEGIDGVVATSAFRSSFGDDYGVRILDGKFAGLLARSIVVLDRDGTVLYTELVPEIGQEPDYDQAVAALQ